MSPRHVVVDGSNIATEGRSLPSLAQLDEAVREFLADNPDDIVTVVVDASFGHRIDPSELPTFEEAEEAGEVVSPPAGAIGRGDAFLLRIAEKTGATVLSNDSFQEFHGEHEWVFERGRLIGGKPVPGVGWIFTPRTPVRGPKSREAVKEAKRRRRGDETEVAPAPSVSTAKGRARKVTKAIATATDEVTANGDGVRRRRRRTSEPPAEPINGPLTFITFIAEHPLGSEVLGVVETFSSHGAFVMVGDVRCYVPLSAMGDPPPRRAREAVAKGEERPFVIQALDPQRRGVELALPGFARVAGGPTEETVEAEIRPVPDDEDTVTLAPARARTPRKRVASPPLPSAELRLDEPSAIDQSEADGVAATPSKPRRSRRSAQPESEALRIAASQAVEPEPERASVEAPASPPRRAARARKTGTTEEAPAAVLASTPKAPAKRSRVAKSIPPASVAASMSSSAKDEAVAGEVPVKKAAGRGRRVAEAAMETTSAGEPLVEVPVKKAAGRGRRSGVAAAAAPVVEPLVVEPLAVEPPVVELPVEAPVKKAAGRRRRVAETAVVAAPVVEPLVEVAVKKAAGRGRRSGVVAPVVEPPVEEPVKKAGGRGRRAAGVDSAAAPTADAAADTTPAKPRRGATKAGGSSGAPTSAGAANEGQFRAAPAPARSQASGSPSKAARSASKTKAPPAEPPAKAAKAAKPAKAAKAGKKTTEPITKTTEPATPAVAVEPSAVPKLRRSRKTTAPSDAPAAAPESPSSRARRTAAATVQGSGRSTGRTAR
jgi:hypothetical protein